MSAFGANKDIEENVARIKTVDDVRRANEMACRDLQIAHYFLADSIGKQLTKQYNDVQVIKKQVEVETRKRKAANSANLKLLISIYKHLKIPIPAIPTHKNSPVALKKQRIRDGLPYPIPLHPQPCTQCVCKIINIPGFHN